jgi:hypothetical protein
VIDLRLSKCAIPSLSILMLLTSITAKQVNITTQDHTQLTGSLIAATDTGDSYVVDVNFCVFDVSVEEFGAGFGVALVDVCYLVTTMDNSVSPPIA